MAEELRRLMRGELVAGREELLEDHRLRRMEIQAIIAAAAARRARIQQWRTSLQLDQALNRALDRILRLSERDIMFAQLIAQVGEREVRGLALLAQSLIQKKLI